MKLQKIETKIYEVRNQKVMLDFDLAELYETETKRLKEAVKRNLARFPADFMFTLTKTEFESLRSQSATSKRGGTRYMPFAFTEQGVAMLASVLNSPKAIRVNIAIVRAFVFTRQCAMTHKELTGKLKVLEEQYNKQFKDVYEALNYLLKKDKLVVEQKERKRIGYKFQTSVNDSYHIYFHFSVSCLTPKSPKGDFYIISFLFLLILHLILRWGL